MTVVLVVHTIAATAWYSFSVPHGTDLAGLEISRYAPLKESGILKPFWQVTFVDDSVDYYQWHAYFWLAQTTLAPVILMESGWREYIIVNCRSTASLASHDNVPKEYSVVKDFGRGLILMRKVCR